MNDFDRSNQGEDANIDCRCLDGNQNCIYPNCPESKCEVCLGPLSADGDETPWYCTNPDCPPDAPEEQESKDQPRQSERFRFVDDSTSFYRGYIWDNQLEKEVELKDIELALNSQQGNKELIGISREDAEQFMSLLRAATKYGADAGQRDKYVNVAQRLSQALQNKS